jgi:hypothetical protein
MLNIKVEINCENAAFAENCEEAVALLLIKIANQMQLGIDADGPILDENGNTVGKVVIERE